MKHRYYDFMVNWVGRNALPTTQARVEMRGFEPLTYALQRHRSPAELHPRQWACQDLNLGPHAYQACALTS